jgi:hypothetical protein
MHGIHGIKKLYILFVYSLVVNNGDELFKD